MHALHPWAVLCSLILFFCPTLIAQEETETPPETWEIGGGLAFDFSQLALINPRVGAGSNRLGFGGMGTLYAKRKTERFQWANDGSLQLGVQRIGKKNRPFEKNLDVLRLDSRAGWVLKGGKLSVATELNWETVLLKTLEGNLLNRPDDLPDSVQLQTLARFLAPMRLSFSPGLEYKPDGSWSIFLAPLGLRWIYVADEEIAALNVHGNESGKNSFLQVGSALKFGYTKKYFDDRVFVDSKLDLFYNFRGKNIEPDERASPKNLDVLWRNEIGWNIAKNFSLNFLTELAWDADVKVLIDDDDDGTPDREGNRVSFTESIVLKYNYIF